MSAVFADTSYWIALLNPRDALHGKAQRVSSARGPARVYTTEAVLTELLNDFSSRGDALRNAAAVLAGALLTSPNVVVVPLTSKRFRDALARYAQRPDKAWSLTDCASFLVREENQLTEALTHDKHFAQAGFRALLRDPI